MQIKSFLNYQALVFAKIPNDHLKRHMLLVVSTIHGIPITGLGKSGYLNS